MATSKQAIGKKSTASAQSASAAGIGMSAGMNAPVKPMAKQMSEEMRYRAEQDMGTLHRAHQIMTDKPRHAAAKQHAAEVFAAANGPGQSVSRKRK